MGKGQGYQAGKVPPAQQCKPRHSHTDGGALRVRTRSPAPWNSALAVLDMRPEFRARQANLPVASLLFFGQELEGGERTLESCL